MRNDIERGASCTNLSGSFWLVANCLPLLETHILPCVRKRTEKCEYRQKNIFLTVNAQKNTHRNMMLEKLIFSVCSPSEKYFSVRSTLTEKCDSPD